MPRMRTRRRHGLVCLPLFALFLLSRPALSIWPFPSERFTPNSLVEAGSMGIGSNDRIIAFGDFNGDQFLDVLALDPDQRTMSVYLWDHEHFQFTRSADIRHPSQVYNAVPGDFTHDGKLDLLVMSTGGNTGSLNMVVYQGFHNGSFDPISLAVPSSTPSQPIPFDANGDMSIDLLGIPFSESDSTTPLKIWQNGWNTSPNPSTLFNLVNPQFNGTQCTLSNPHSNAVIDLNGDCLADIFLMCEDNSGQQFFQIWINNKDEGFSLAQEAYLPFGTQAISFADMDRDGTIDMVFPTCSSVSSTSGIGFDCYINIAYNKQLPLCASATSPTVNNQGQRVCRSPEELCIADPNFKFDLSSRYDNTAMDRIPLSSILASSGISSAVPSLLVLDTTFTPPIPLPIRLGDANLDGFPDLLLIAVYSGSKIPKLAVSQPCTKGLPGCDTNGQGRRGWNVLSDDVESLEEISDARGVAFIDMDEDGTLDILVQRSGNQGQGSVMFVQNNFYYDAFFLKAIVLNGACNNGWCTASNGSSYLPFGVSYSGASFKYTVLDTSGSRSAAQVGQLPQTSYHSLLPPYAFFGLGRTNNYIENLFVGSTKHSSQHYINMEGVIPNSRVVIHPPVDDSEGWKRELFLRPGRWIPWVTVTVLAVMALLATVVFVLHLNEKREDELERRKYSHHINFDAL